jgi:hypothetical protein
MELLYALLLTVAIGFALYRIGRADTEKTYIEKEMKANEEKAKGGKKSDDDEELLKELENM